MLDAATYLKEFNRMCLSYGSKCAGCPADGRVEDEPYYTICNKMYDKPELIVAAVEKWSKENPVITNKDKFDLLGWKREYCLSLDCNNRGHGPQDIPCYSCSWWTQEAKSESDKK
jgi:hypothetical protein